MKKQAETSTVAEAEKPVAQVEDEKLSSEETKVDSTSPQKSRLASYIERARPLLQSKKFLAITSAVVLLLVALFAVPLTRYMVLGLVVKRDFNIVVRDVATQRVVSGANVEIDGHSFITNKDGMTALKGIKVGEHKVAVTKKHYKDLTTETLVTLQKNKTVDVKLEATGRQVPVVVKNKISGSPVSDALLKAGDSDTQTDKDGMAIIVVPVGSDEVKATLSASGYNETSVTVKVTEAVAPENTFTIAPVGKVYFLSKQSGKIDVVKTNLDGSDRETVLAGTGREEDYATVLLASRDWKYLALQSRRDSDKSKLYLIETETGKLTTMDEGDAFFSIHGWSGHNFVYTVARAKANVWDSKRQALKAFNADSKQIALLSETQAEGSQFNYAYESFGNVTVFEDVVVLSRSWAGSYWSNFLNGKNFVIASVGLDGKNYKELKTLSMSNYYLNARLYAPKEIVFMYAQSVGTGIQFFEYEDGHLKEAKDITREQFEKPYPTYLLSPSGDKTLWTDSRDGRNVVFAGDKDGKNENVIANFSEFAPFGWYSDDYVLVSKKGSELYIMPSSGAKDETGLLKISNYHRPDRSFDGYGGGYGGL